MNANTHENRPDALSFSHRLRGIHRSAAGILTLLMVFYFLLLAAGLTPSPFEAGQGGHYIRYGVLSLVVAYVAAFALAPASAAAESPAPVGRAGRMLAAARQAAWLFPVSWAVLAVIQASNHWLGLPAPLAATRPAVVLALVGVALVFGFLMALAERSGAGSGKPQAGG